MTRDDVTRDELAQAVGRGDLDELVGLVDRVAVRDDWDTLSWLRDRCEAAAEETGRQLWGVARFADYRIALDAPASVAASVVVPGAGRFALGPLSEVVAQSHQLAQLVDHLDPTVIATVAQERVLRGEDLMDGSVAWIADLRDEVVAETGVPAILEPWEPTYVVPTFRAFDRLDGDIDVAIAGPQMPDDEVDAGWIDRMDADVALRRALEALVSPWVEQSSGSVRVVVEAGDDRVLGPWLDDARRRPVRIDLREAMARMAFAAASGGVRGRRRGAAAGRSAAWWVATAATGLDFGPDPDELEYRLATLRWWSIAPEVGRHGWHLGLAVSDPTEGWIAAIDAWDQPDQDQSGQDQPDQDQPDEPDRDADA